MSTEIEAERVRFVDFEFYFQLQIFVVVHSKLSSKCNILYATYNIDTIIRNEIFN